MKKNIYILLAGLAIGLTACEEKIDYSGQMQTSPQLPIISADGWGVNLNTALDPNSNLDLNSYSDPLTPINVATVVKPDDLPSSAVVSLSMQMAGGANEVVVPMEDNNGTYTVTAQAWSDAFRELYGKSPATEVNNLQFAIYVTLDSQLNRVGSADTWFGQTYVNVTPIDLGIYVEPAYYILLSNIGNGTIQDAIKMDHSADANQYDDPVFSFVYDIPDSQAGFQWYVIPESYYEAALASGSALIPQEGWYQAENASQLTGNLVMSGEPAGTTTIAGNYLFTINMYPGAGMNPSYNISLAVETLYVYGVGNNYSFKNNWLTTYNNVNYFGFVHLNGNFKVAAQASQKGTLWGAGQEEGTMAVGGDYIKGPEDGLYWMNVDISTLKYSTLAIEHISIIGNLSEDNNWATDVELTPDKNFQTWTGTVTFEVEGGGWKFRTNNDWNGNPNLGYQDADDPYSALVNDGGDLPIPAEGLGTYEVTLDLKTIPYSCTLVKQ